MKATLTVLFVLTIGLTGVGAQEVTTVQVAPSDQVVYPDASQILNKTEPTTVPKTDPKATGAHPLPAALPSSKPLVGSAPVPAKPLAAAKPLPPAKPAPALQGWYLRWTLTGDETGARAWATARGATQVSALGPDTWEVLAGPLAAQDLPKALEGQAGKSELVRR